MPIGRHPIGRGAIGRGVTSSGPAGGALVGNLALDNVLLGGSLRVPYRLVSSEHKTTAPMLLANETGITVHVYELAGPELVTKTGQVTNGAGIMTVFYDALVLGTTYRVIYVYGDGSEGLERLTAQ